MSKFDDAFKPRAPDPKPIYSSLQSSLWRNLRHLYPNRSQSGTISWLLIRSVQPGHADHAGALEALGGLGAKELYDLSQVVQKTAASTTGSGREEWARVSNEIVRAVGKIWAAKLAVGA